MQLAKSIIPKKIKTLYCFCASPQGISLTILVLFSCMFSTASAQDNSPYSRYGIGDLLPGSHIINQSMGGVSAAYNDFYSINFSNPASYSSFETGVEAKSKKLVTGRAILDVGLDFDNRTLTDPGFVQKFTASNALFSYVQVGVPLKKNWGFSFGLRPVSRISYKINRKENLYNPIPPFDLIDSASTLYQGDGGSYLASIGTGFSIFSRTKKSMIEKLSIGVNGGYFFGRKDYRTERSFINDSVSYITGNFETKTNFNNLYFNTGIQYQIPLSEAKKLMLTIGAFGSWSQKLNARQDLIRQTTYYNETLGTVQLDSVSQKLDVKGEVIMPSSFTVGFTVRKFAVINKESGWLLGVDYEKQNWNEYRIYGQQDSVQNTGTLRVGAQFNPVPKRNYFSNIAYRLGFFTGPDYINLGEKLSRYGASLGLGLPLTRNRQAPNQLTFINVGLEFSKRGNNNNLLKENLFRLSLGFSLSDIWFIKRKYE